MRSDFTVLQFLVFVINLMSAIVRARLARQSCDNFLISGEQRFLSVFKPREFDLSKSLIVSISDSYLALLAHYRSYLILYNLLIWSSSSKQTLQFYGVSRSYFLGVCDRGTFFSKAV